MYSVDQRSSWSSDLTRDTMRITMRAVSRSELLLRSLNPSARVS
jgi:hypothetical protein